MRLLDRVLLAFVGIGGIVVCGAVTMGMLAAFHPVSAQQGSSSLPSYPIGVHITTQTATAVKTSVGTLHTLTVNTAGASAVISIYDLSGANCTGTPSNPVISITLPASGVLPGSLLYDKQFTNGICVQDAVASSDLTVTAF